MSDVMVGVLNLFTENTISVLMRVRMIKLMMVMRKVKDVDADDSEGD